MGDQRTNRERGRKRFRKLRIAWSVAWGIACLLLVVLWVRSYSRYDNVGLRISGNRLVCANSYWGKLELVTVYTRAWPNDPQFHWKSRAANWMPATPTWYSGSTVFQQSTGMVSLRYWPLILISAALAAMATITHWRFSLRALLIAITLAAVALGVIVYMLRN
jgi:hypothetical protein